jgi:osmoprotectant transport system substrate-binding protein
MRSILGIRPHRLRVLAAPVAIVLAAGIALGGCGLQSGSAYVANVSAGTIKPIPALQGKTLTVGSKDFDEQIILGYIAVIALKAAGATIVDRTNIKGSDSQRQALLAGGVDLEWEYTGTGWISYLKQTTPLKDPRQQYLAVKNADVKNGITWIDPAPMNNTYAFGITAASQQKYNLHTMSDIKRLAQTNPKAATFCLESEFNSRDDGMPGVKKTYGFTVPGGNIQVMDTGLVYTRTQQGACTFGEIFTTDGRVKGLGLKVLTDDKAFFPNYNAAISVRTKIFQQYPQIEQLFAPIAAKLTTEEISVLNTKVTVAGDDPSQVALNWMVKNGFVRSPDAQPNSST